MNDEATYAGWSGMAGEIAGKSVTFCVGRDVPLPLYAKVTDNGVELEYTLVEAQGL